MSKLSDIIKSVAKKLEQKAPEALEDIESRPLPSRALSTSEQEAAEDLFNMSPSMKKMAQDEQDHILSRTDEPNFTLQGNPYSGGQLVPTGERSLSLNPEMATLNEEASSALVPSGPRAMSTNVIDGQFKDVSEIPGVKGKSKWMTPAVLGALGIGGTMLLPDGTTAPPPQEPPKSLSDDQLMTPAPQNMNAKAPIKKASKLPVEQIQNPEIKPASDDKVLDPKTQENLTQPEDKSMTLDVGQQNFDAQQGLKDAQNERDMRVLFNQLGKISERGAGQIGHFKSQNGDIYDEGIKQANNSVSDFQEKQKQEENNPSSPTSKAFKQYMAKFGVKVQGDFTAKMGEQLMPIAYKSFEMEEARRNKSADLKSARELKEMEANASREADEKKYKYLADERKFLALEKEKDRKANKGVQISEKQAQLDDKKFDRLNEKMSEDIASGRSAFGISARNLQSVQNAKALLNSELDPNNLDNRQVYEMAKSLDRILSQTGATISGTDKLTPDTARARIAKQLEFITNKRIGAGAGDFMKNISHTLDREQDVAKKQVSKTQQDLISGQWQLFDRNPERAKDILDRRGLGYLLDEREKKKNGQETSSEIPKSSKTIIKKGYNAKTNQTQLVYSDGTKEIVDGKQ